MAQASKDLVVNLTLVCDLDLGAEVIILSRAEVMGGTRERFWTEGQRLYHNASAF